VDTRNPHLTALVRAPADSIAGCELSYLARAPIDVALARRQHLAYVHVLAELGCQIEWLPELPECPDGVFVEDTAVVVPELRVLTSPGVASRRGEVGSVASALAAHGRTVAVRPPATLEGGDVLRIGRALYVGTSARSNAAGVAELAAALAPFGYEVRAVAMQGCLHLKSAATYIAPDLLLANPDWVDPGVFAVARVITVAAGEEFGANTLTVSGTTLVSAEFPLTRRRLEQAGIRTRALDVSELHKAEAALTCLSILIEPASGAHRLGERA
jgi:dimethylargininase